MSDPLAFVFASLEEGMPADEIARRIRERGLDAHALAEQVKVYRDNLREDAGIPGNVTDDDGSYRAMRSFSRTALPELDRLIVHLAGLSLS